jgi:hypothetical protein
MKMTPECEVRVSHIVIVAIPGTIIALQLHVIAVVHTLCNLYRPHVVGEIPYKAMVAPSAFFHPTYRNTNAVGSRQCLTYQRWQGVV